MAHWEKGVRLAEVAGHGVQFHKGLKPSVAYPQPRCATLCGSGSTGELLGTRVLESTGLSSNAICFSSMQWNFWQVTLFLGL